VNQDTVETALSLADYFANRLCRDALWSGSRCNWLGDSMEPVDGAWRVVRRTFGPELYSGTAGIALFLGHAFRASSDDVHLRTAMGAADHAISTLDSIPPSLRHSLYSGALGVAYAFADLGWLLDNIRLKALSQSILDGLGTEVPEDTGLDLIAGSAGAIVGLLVLHEREPRPELLGLAIRHGERLLRAARVGSRGWSWKTLPGTEGEDLTGLSHGAAGIAWALLELHRATGGSEFLEAARGGFDYEQSWFSSQEGNWPDLRPDIMTGLPAQQLAYGVTWCHGAPGIGLSRLRASRILGDKHLLDEALVAARTTALRQPSFLRGPGANFSLCHGAMGNLDLLLELERGQETVSAAPASSSVVAAVMEHWTSQKTWPCGVLNGGETPGLLLGLAGMGYGMLRVARPATTPSVLFTSPRSEVLSTASPTGVSPLDPYPRAARTAAGDT